MFALASMVPAGVQFRKSVLKVATLKTELARLQNIHHSIA